MRLKALSLVMACVVMTGITHAQQLEVHNADQKISHSFKPGSEIDFRVDYDLLYPNVNDSILEVRCVSVIDSIMGDVLVLSENVVTAQFTKTEGYGMEKELAVNAVKINVGDIKAVNQQSSAASVGESLMWLGAAVMVVSPLVGLAAGGGDGFAEDRATMVFGIGLGTFAIGGGMKLLFKKGPYKVREFEGPGYYKKYEQATLKVVAAP